MFYIDNREKGELLKFKQQVSSFEDYDYASIITLQ